MGKKSKVMLVVLGFLLSIVTSSFALGSSYDSANNKAKDTTVKTSRHTKSKGKTHRTHRTTNKTKHMIKENRR